MTTDADTRALEEKRETLWITDAELIRRLGAPEKIARDALRMLDRDRASGFPPKSKLWGDRRYWPAVKAYFDAVNGFKLSGAARLIPESRIPHPVAASHHQRSPERRGHHGTSDNQ